MQDGQGQVHVPVTARRFVRREELCPNLWSLLETAVEVGGFNLQDFREHLESCTVCQEQLWKAAERGLEKAPFDGGTSFLLEQLLKKMRRMWDSYMLQIAELKAVKHMVQEENMREGSLDTEG